MPRIRSMLPCLALLIITACTSQLPQPQIITPAHSGLSGLHRFSLAADTDTPQTSAQQVQLQGLLLKALTQRGYQHAEAADMQVQYWLTEQTIPLPINVDSPAPEPLGPYQAVHHLQTVSATVRVRLHDLRQNTLWEAQIDTPLSPANQRTDLLAQAVETLINALPRAGN